jgi:hypothetical protein
MRWEYFGITALRSFGSLLRAPRLVRHVVPLKRAGEDDKGCVAYGNGNKVKSIWNDNKVEEF